MCQTIVQRAQVKGKQSDDCFERQLLQNKDHFF